MEGPDQGYAERITGLDRGEAGRQGPNPDTFDY
ncbi:aldo/keto reductase, partial [Micromonospora sp. AMSO12t]